MAAPGNVLFIVLDQLRADVLTGALSAAAQIPNIRALMDDGTTFTRHFGQATPCGPARASLLTGLYAMNHRSVRNGTPLAAHHTNIALEARKAGIEPLLFGYTDTSPDPTGRPENDPALTSYEGLLPGFTEVAQLRFESPGLWVADLIAKGYDVPLSAELLAAVDPEGRGRLDAPTRYSAEDSDTAFLTNATLAGLAIRPAPWFAHVNYIRPHPPLAAPAPWCSAIDPADVPRAHLPASVDAERQAHPFSRAWLSEPTMASLYIGFDGRMDAVSEDDRQTLRAVYLGLVVEVDHHIGRLVDQLKARGQYDDTLIVLTSDHGEMLGDHYQWGKETVYEPGFHVPLVIRDPHRRDAAGSVVDAFTESVDIAPTILNWLGAPAPLAMNGRSLLPFLNGETPPGWRDYACSEIDLGHPITPTRFQRHFGLDLLSANATIIREAGWKYVHFNGGVPPMLFDLEADPHEMHNLADDPAHAGERLRLAEKMLDHRMTHAHHALSLMQITGEGVRAAPAPAY